MNHTRTTTIAHSEGSQTTITSVEYDDIQRIRSADSTANSNRRDQMTLHQQELPERMCLKYIFEPLTLEVTPDDTYTPTFQSVHDEMEKLQIKSRLVFWLIGSEENEELKSPYGRRFIKDFLNVVLDSGALLICQGTNGFFGCIRAHCNDPKLKSAKKKIKVLICKNVKDYFYKPEIEATQYANEQDCFQLVLLFEGSCVNYRTVHPCIPSNAKMILFKDVWDNVKAPQNCICVLGLETKYGEDAFSIEKFIFEAFQNNEALNNERNDEDSFLLCIYLNQTTNKKQINFEMRLKEAALTCVRLYRQNCLTVICQKGYDLMQLITENDVIDHLKTVSWCSKLCSNSRIRTELTLPMVKSEIDRRIEEIVGKNSFRKKEGNTLNLAEVLFVDAILENKLEASILYWTLVEHPVTAALIACGLFNAMRQTDNSTALKENTNTYNRLAVEAVNSSYVKNSSDTFTMLLETVEEWGDASCVQIALATDNKAFLSEQPLVDLQERLWYGQPLAAESSKSATETRTRFLKTFRAPQIVYRYTLALYLIFLVMYGLLLMFFLETTKFHFLEFIIPAWVLTLALQMIQKTLPFNKHLIDAFYLVDAFAIVFYVMALCLRVAAFYNPSYQDIMDVARLLYSLDYMAFTLRLLHFCMGNRSLGPITAMIFGMFTTLFRFLAIIGIFLFGAVVATESVMYPQAPLQITELYFIFRKPYWSMFGEFFLSEIESRGDYCTNDPTLYNNHTEIRCSTDVGRYYGPVIMAMFVLVVNLLIFSLVVSQFNSTITEIEERSKEVSHYQRFKITLEYYRMIFLQPPLLVLCIVFGVFRYHEEKKTKDPNLIAYLLKFEKDIVQYIKQQIDDGSFFECLKDYKKVDRKRNLNTLLHGLSEIKNLLQWQKKAEKDLQDIKMSLEITSKSLQSNSDTEGILESLRRIEDTLRNLNGAEKTTRAKQPSGGNRKFDLPSPRPTQIF